MNDLRYVVFDTETTGIHKGKKAVDIAGIEIDPDTYEILGEFESLIDPEEPIPADTSAIHGISDDMVRDSPTIGEFVEGVLGGRLEGPVVLIGHRISFDEPLFAPIGDVRSTFDTLVLAQSLQLGFENNKLDTLKEGLQLEGGGKSHRAMADVITCHQLLQVLIPMTGRSLIQHCATGEQAIHHMPWGKWEGELLINVPKTYRNWVLSLPDLEPNLKRSLKALQKASL